jgi:hypothetical protein
MRFRTTAALLMMLMFARSAYAEQPQTTVKPEKHIDSLWNGALIGAGVGAASAWVFTRANCGPRGYDNECSAIAGLASTIVFVPAGTIAGAIIDRLINKTLPPGAAAHTAVGPMLSSKNGRPNAGVALRLKIGF